MSGPLMIFVDKASAMNGRDWEANEAYIRAISTDHSNMIKFANQDEHYKLVLGVVQFSDYTSAQNQIWRSQCQSKHLISPLANISIRTF